MKSIHRKTKYPPKFVFGGIYGACGNLVLREGQIFDALNLEKQMTCQEKQIKLNIERKQRERPFEKSACAHLITPINVHLHILRFMGFSAFVFYKR